jgi:hypothetical protein
MSRIVWDDAAADAGSSRTIEVHYQSPHEFVKDLDAATSPERLFVQTERTLAPGSQHTVVLHVGFVARTLRLNARVESRVEARKATPGAAGARDPGRPAGLLLRLLGPDGCASAELRNLVQQIQQGSACQAAAGAIPTTGERMQKDRALLTMPATLKMMHALKADKEDRLVLATDVDPRSIEFLLKNPSITLQEIRTLSARPTLITAHIQAILAKNGWKADDQVRLNLARNPRLPDIVAESLLETLTVPQLKIVVGSQTITATVKRIVHRLLQARGQ